MKDNNVLGYLVIILLASGFAYARGKSQGRKDVVNKFKSVLLETIIKNEKEKA